MNLDAMVFQFLYGQCKTLGTLVGAGALEGLILWAGMITTVTLKVLDKKGKK